jgi:c-di-GMP-binding flagellar brake protein YcgR
MEKKRKPDRKPLKLYMNVFDTKTDQLFGHMVDITKKGLMLTSEQPIETDAQFDLRLELPTEIKGSKELSFSAQSIWSEKDSETDFYNTGFQFSEVSSKDAKIIKQLIKKYCF